MSKKKRKIVKKYSESRGIKDEMDVIVEAIKQDPGYRQAWISNISVCIQDEMRRRFNDCIHEASNKAAKDFLDILCRDRDGDE